MAEYVAPLAVVPLVSQCQVIIRAVDPTTGADVSGVTITNPTIYGYLLGGSIPEGVDNSPDALLVPQAPA